MNMNEVIWQLLRSGFPLLVIVVYGILLYNTWNNSTFDTSQKWKWSLIIVVPGLIGLVALLTMLNMEPENNHTVLNILTLITLFVPFSGVLAWLIGTR